jgi:DNA-binding GntR family transcriptional regulator
MPHRSDLGRLNLGVDARTLAASITNTLRSAILGGQLAPGEALGQEALAQRFGVSRIPVRESLKQLEAEGLVEARPHRGAVVARLSVEELDELYGIVWALELVAVRAAVPRMTDEQVATMGTLLERLASPLEPHEWYATSVQFHMQMLEASGLHRVIRIVGECRRNIGRYVIDPALFRSQVATWLERNRALHEACRRRDVDAAVAALEVMRTVSTADVRDALRAGETVAPQSKKRKAA